MVVMYKTSPGSIDQSHRGGERMGIGKGRGRIRQTEKPAQGRGKGKVQSAEYCHLWVTYSSLQL